MHRSFRAPGRAIGPRFVRLSAVASLVLAVTACSNPSGPERSLSGKRIYDRNCARCHGFDGRPTKESPGARDLSNKSYIESLSDETIRGVIEGGRPPSMPAFRGQFMEPSMKLLVAYVRSLSDPEAGQAVAAPADDDAGE